jgi:hypothetical protein
LITGELFAYIKISSTFIPGKKGLNSMSHFKSVVVVLEEKTSYEQIIELNSALSSSGYDFELIVVVANLPASSQVLRSIEDSIEDFNNLRLIYLSGSHIPIVSALWSAIDSSIGDRITVMFSLVSSLEDLDNFWKLSLSYDSFFGYPSPAMSGRSPMQRILERSFRNIYKFFIREPLETRPIFIAELSRQFVHFLQKTRQPEIALRNSHLFMGFTSSNTTLPSAPAARRRSSVELIARGLEILFSVSYSPLRAISVLALSGAILNVVYSIYVLASSLTGPVSQGWTSMSLQISGMFLLVSLVLAVMCEFLIFLYQSTSQTDRYFIARELNSPHSGLSKRLNVVSEQD